MSDRLLARARGRGGWPRQNRLLALVGSLSAAVAFLATAGAVQAAPSAAAGSGGPGPTVALTGATATVPPGARSAGVEPRGSIVHLDVVLSPRDPAALTRYATQVATPGSPLYHVYLPRGAFPMVFGPTRAAIAAVRSALGSVGLHPGKVSANHLAIPVTATAGQVESAFGIRLNRYRLPGGRVGYANLTAPRLPATAARYVESIIGLDTLIKLQPLLARPGKVTAKPTAHLTTPKVRPQVGTGGPQPCQSALNEQAAIFNNSGGAQWVLTADQMANEYEYDKLYRAGDFGKGQTVGIIELDEPNLNSDIAAYQNCYHTHVSVSYLNIDGFKPKGAGEGEAALDIETVLVMAPRAHVVVYRGKGDGNGWYDTFATAAIRDVAQVESVSYGLCELAFGQILGKNLAGALHVIFEQQAVQGQTVVVSSGDDGSEGCLRVSPSQTNLLSVSYPGSDPFVLSVGGTSVINNNPVPRQEEVVWNDAFDGNGAGGGGESAFFNEPSYQKSFPGIPSTGGTRGVPDVSADADPETGYLVWHAGGWFQVGGTSAAAPMWAALLALTNAKCSSSPVGFVNPAIYFAASPSVPAIVLDDIQTDSRFPGNDNNDFTGDGGGQYPVLNGYDMATGLGSMVGGALANQLCKTSSEAKGYRLVSASGHVYSFHAPGYGSASRVSSKVVGIADDPKTNGYWLVTAQGHVYAFHAPFRGSARNLRSPIVGIAADKAGTGYWLVTAKGHVYAFHAPSHGSVGGRLASPVVGIAADPFTNGYWVVTARGKVYAFDAGRYKGKNLSRVTGIAADPRKQAYWLVTAVGHVYGFNVSSLGSMPVRNLFGNITGIAGDPASGGYWLTTSFGIVAGFNAKVHGAHPFQTSRNPMVGIASTH